MLCHAPLSLARYIGSRVGQMEAGLEAGRDDPKRKAAIIEAAKKRGDRSEIRSPSLPNCTPLSAATDGLSNDDAFESLRR